MKKLIVFGPLIFVLLIPIATLPTCIIFYKANNGTVYVAADSRRTVKEIRQTLNFKDQYAESCKLEIIKGYCFGIAGHMDTYIQETIERQLRWSNNIRVVEKNTMDSASIGLLEELRIEKSQNPEQYSAYLNQGQITIAGFVYYNKHPTIDILAWKLMEINGTPQIQSLYGYDRGTSYIGISDHLNANSKEFKKAIPDTTNPEKYLKAQIMLESSYHPNDIGAPIDVFRLSKFGKFSQLTRKRNCDSLKAAHPEIYFWYNN